MSNKRFFKSAEQQDIKKEKLTPQILEADLEPK
jgi:hypothetical protein